MRFLPLGLALFATSCSLEPNAILVTLSNVPSRTDKIAVNAKLEGAPAMGALSLAKDAASFGVKLGPEKAGRLVLNVDALDVDGCTQGFAAPEYDLPLEYTDTQLSLNAQSPRRCGSFSPCAQNAACAITKVPDVTSHIESMWAFSPTDIWAVGHLATILHFDGVAWKAYDFGLFGKPTGDFYGVWGSAPDDIWAVGTFGLIEHYDGTKWTNTTSPTSLALYGVWGLNRTEVYAVGQSSSPGTAQGVFLRYNGSSWSNITTAGLDTFNSVWADNSSDSTLIYACGNNGMLVRYDPSKSPMWASIISNTTNNLNGIWGTRSSTKGSFNNTVFTVGAGGTILRFRFGVDLGWLPLSTTGTTMNFYGVRGNDTQELVFAYGQGGTVVRAAPPYDTFTAQTSSVGAQIFTAAFSRSDQKGGLVWLGGGSGTLGFIDLNP
jgi:hypothetical protein